MSEPIPESIPTSADPRSKRPLKKRALQTPTASQAASLTALFSKPDQEISIPSSSSTSLLPHNSSHPPEIVANVQGSSAGAGSGEFHVYKASRRREYERLRGMGEEVQKEKDGEGWEKEKSEREERDREKTRKNREKREKLKARKGKGLKGATGKEGEDGGEIKPKFDTGSVANSGDGLEKRDGEMKGEEIVGVVIHDDDD